jgi:hypothetical protein
VWVFLIFILVWLAFAVVFGGVLVLGTLWLQGYLYTEPATGLLWRGPAAGAALGLFFAFWCLLGFLNPGEFEPLWSFSPRVRKEFPEIEVVRGNDRGRYKLSKDAQGKVVYWDQYRKPPPEHSDEIVVQEDGQEVHFKAERWPSGPNKDKLKIEQGQSLHYVDEHGRVMLESDLGRVYTVRTGRLVLNLFLNVFHFALWFVCLWLLLRFQWAHALGLAVALWLVMTIPVQPVLLKKAEDLGQERARQRAAANLLPYRMCMMSPSWTTYPLPSSR